MGLALLRSHARVVRHCLHLRPGPALARLPLLVNQPIHAAKRTN